MPPPAHGEGVACGAEKFVENLPVCLIPNLPKRNLPTFGKKSSSGIQVKAGGAAATTQRRRWRGRQTGNGARQHRRPTNVDTLQIQSLNRAVAWAWACKELR